ncbi:MAG TPA: hypothetical protein VMW48_09890 [Vicinamibacterales bacterium]|nr:hypothetical protein [Vicinamibacterales bacterium]
MDISVDRYLDDGPTRLFTLVLRSRTTEGHSLMTALDGAQKAAVQAALARAMADITAVLRPVAAALPDRKG